MKRSSRVGLGLHFFFGAVWACVKKMWLLGVGLLAVFFVLGVAAGGNESLDNLINILSLAVSIVFGIHGNRLRERKRLFVDA
ncbi:hypothetical protein AABM17_623 [Neisseria musculi]|uniref:DUF2628 domain-containing protein n=1 Tax=Neisseria musculi TaxID=1815583 RepID=A0A7H1M7W0_9NEIS|nr:hypothetical protein H7A79_0623 [Neisseria musculi]